MLRLATAAGLLTALLSGCGALPELPAGAAHSAADSRAAPSSTVDDMAQRRFHAAIVAMAAGDGASARTDFEWLIASYPELSGPHLNLALLEQQQGRLEQAEPLFLAALAANPGNLTAYNEYAVFLRRQGRFEAAKSTYLAALAVAPDHAPTHRNLGVLYDLYRGNAEQALQHYYRYQSLTEGQDRLVAGWIIDLERRYSALVQQETP